MPFSIVITREGISDAVVAVPSDWVINNVLHWPKTNKKAEQELLRSNGVSKPEENWKKQKCRVKEDNIETFEEAMQKEEIYAKFNDTDEEQTYFHRHESKKPKYYDTVDLNTEFETVAPASGYVPDIDDKNSNEVIILSDVLICQPSTSKSEPVQISATDTVKNTEGFAIDAQHNIATPVINSQISKEIFTKDMDTKQSDDQNYMMCDNSEDMLLLLSGEHNKMYVENQKLKEINQKLEEKNKMLKEEKENALKFEKYHQDIEHRFISIQVMLDRILSEKGSQTRDPEAEDDIQMSELRFPLESIEDLKILEQKLGDKDLESQLIKKFTRTYGTDGKHKLHRFGLALMSEIIKDECLSLCTWKGIKGCTKTPFRDFIKIREMIFKIIRMADRSCSLKEIDDFLQHSAIKHSSQRLKRKTSKSVPAQPSANAGSTASSAREALILLNEEDNKVVAQSSSKAQE